MISQHRNWSRALASFVVVTIAAASVSAQTTNGWSTGFESTVSAQNPVAYSTGSLVLQDGWDLGGAGRSPRVQTTAEIGAELTAAGLNVAQPTHSGDQALLVAKTDALVEASGYFVRDIFPVPNTLETATKVTVDFWARPLTGGAGANPAGTPSGNDKTIGEREGNMFFGVSGTDDGANPPNGQRIAAVRFGVDVVPGTPTPPPLYGNITERHIDFASSNAGVWNKSGLLWTPDTWYNFRFEIDLPSKTYDFYVNDAKANVAPIAFYHAAATSVARFFVSRGTNQAGSILDDVSVTPFVPPSADFNVDSDVDGDDFNAWVGGLGTASGGALANGDSDGDGDIDGGDFLVWQQQFGTGLPGAAAVPEPASASMAVLALLGAAAATGRRRRSACLADPGAIAPRG